MDELKLPTVCNDCGGALREVTLFSRSIESPLGLTNDSASICYTDAKTEFSRFWGMFEAEGTVRALLCQACGRIFLYASPKEKE